MTISETGLARTARLSEALDVVVRLHDREVDAAFLAGFSEHRMADWLTGQLETDDGKDAAKALGAVVARIDPQDQSARDELAAEYADLYLTHGYRVSPSGSVWLTEDHLERQLPMFDVRDWYAHYDITVPDWRKRADDHLVHELQFVSFLCRSGSKVGAEDAARFLDLHVLPWVPEFCQQALPRLDRAFYGAAFELTLAVLEELRQVLEQVTGQEREVRLTAPPVANRAPETDTAFIPGVAESW